MNKFLAFFLLIAWPGLAFSQTLENPPWKNGEKLTYSVHWGALLAAKAVFTAKDAGDHWEFRLHLVSDGPVNTIYPIQDWYWTFQSKQPWRSTQYGEERFEKGRHIYERTIVDYKEKTGKRDRWNLGKVETFNWDGRDLDDVGSMLYTMRCGEWKKGQSRQMFVYESSNVKNGEAVCDAIEEKKFGSWPLQKLISITARPNGGDHKRYKLALWMSDDEKRLPIHARLNFKYGTFTINLIKVEAEP